MEKKMESRREEDTRRDMATTSGEETEHTSYSRVVHKVIVVVNGGIIGFLQLKNQTTTTTTTTTSSVLDSNHASFLCFWVLALIYVLLRVSEVKLRGAPVIRHFAGDMSHLFGALAALVLISVLCSTFALVLFPLWFLWLFLVVFVFFRDISDPEANPSPPGPVNP